MLIYHDRLIGTPILTVQTGSQIATISNIIVNPDNLKVVAFVVSGPRISQNNILDVASVREYSSYGIVIDDVDQLVAPSDIIKIKKILDLNFDLIGLKVESKKGSKIGKLINYSLTSDDFIVQQIIVQRPTLKRFTDPELTIHRREIIEITDYKIIVKDEAKTIKARSEKEDFVPNFVNPFREPGFAPTDTKIPDAQDN